MRLRNINGEKLKGLKKDKGYMGRMSFPENTNKPARTVMATLTFSSRESMILGFNISKYRSYNSRSG